MLSKIAFSYPILSFASKTELDCLAKVTDAASRVVAGAIKTSNGECGVLAGIKPLNAETDQAVADFGMRA